MKTKFTVDQLSAILLFSMIDESSHIQRFKEQFELTRKTIALRNLVNDKGQTLFQHAVCESRYEIANYLFDQCQDDHKQFLNEPDDENNTPLSILLSIPLTSNDIEKVYALTEKLIDKFRDEPTILFKHNNPLSIASRQKANSAAEKDSKWKFIKLVLITASQTETIGKIINVADKEGLTPLHYACINEEIGIINLLLKHEAVIASKKIIVNAVDNKGLTPLHYACINGNIEIINILLDHEADMTRKDREGFTTLHHAADNKQARVVELIIYKNSNLINMVDNKKQNPLIVASRVLNNELCCSILLEKVDKNERQEYVNETNFSKNTALHYACANEEIVLAELLIRYGADETIVNRRGKTPFQSLNDKTMNLFLDYLNKKGRFIGERGLSESIKQNLEALTHLKHTDYNEAALQYTKNFLKDFKENKSPIFDEILKEYLGFVAVKKGLLHYMIERLTYDETFSSDFFNEFSPKLNKVGEGLISMQKAISEKGAEPIPIFEKLIEKYKTNQNQELIVAKITTTEIESQIHDYLIATIEDLVSLDTLLEEYDEQIVLYDENLPGNILRTGLSGYFSFLMFQIAIVSLITAIKNYSLSRHTSWEDNNHYVYITRFALFNLLTAFSSVLSFGLGIYTYVKLVKTIKTSKVIFDKNELAVDRLTQDEKDKYHSIICELESLKDNLGHNLSNADSSSDNDLIELINLTDVFNNLLDQLKKTETIGKMREKINEVEVLMQKQMLPCVNTMYFSFWEKPSCLQNDFESPNLIADPDLNEKAEIVLSKQDIETGPIELEYQKSKKGTILQLLNFSFLWTSKKNEKIEIELDEMGGDLIERKNEDEKPLLRTKHGV